MRYNMSVSVCPKAPKAAKGLTKAAHSLPRTAQGRPKAAQGCSGANLQNLSPLGIFGHRLVRTNVCPKAPKAAQGLTKAAYSCPRTAQGRPKAAQGFSGANLQNLSPLGIFGHRLVRTNLCPKAPKAAQGLTKAVHGHHPRTAQGRPKAVQEKIFRI